MKKITLVMAAAVLSGAGLAVALPQPPGPPGARLGGPLFDLTEVLRLSEAQKTAWKEIQDEHRTQMQPLFEEGRKLHEEMRAALDEPSPEPAKVGALAITLQRHRKQVESARKSFEEKQAELLDSDQRKRLDALRAMRPRVGPGSAPGGRRGPHGPPPFEVPLPFPQQ